MNINISEIKKKIDKVKKDTKDIAQNQIAEETKDVLIKHAQLDIYDAYNRDNMIYQRNYSLINENNIKTEEYGELGISLTYDVYYDDKYIPDVVETAKGYDYTGYGYSYEQPRPFIENSVREIKSTEMVESILKRELKNKGYNV